MSSNDQKKNLSDLETSCVLLGSCVNGRFQMVYYSVFDNLKNRDLCSCDLHTCFMIEWWSNFHLPSSFAIVIERLQSKTRTNLSFYCEDLLEGPRFYHYTALSLSEKSHDIIGYLLSTGLRKFVHWIEETSIELVEKLVVLKNQINCYLHKHCWRPNNLFVGPIFTDLKGYEVRSNNWVGLSTCFFSVVVKSKTVWRDMKTTYVHILLYLIYVPHCYVMS